VLSLPFYSASEYLHGAGDVIISRDCDVILIVFVAAATKHYLKLFIVTGKYSAVTITVPVAIMVE